MSLVHTITALSSRQIFICISMGVVLWLAAALMLSALSGYGIHEGAGRVYMYAATIPGTAPFVFLIARLAAFAKGQTGTGVAIGVGAAVLLDGLALAWAPGLYGGVQHVAGAGSVILWGAGVAIVQGFGYDALRR